MLLTFSSQNLFLLKNDLVLTSHITSGPIQIIGNSVNRRSDNQRSTILSVCKGNFNTVPTYIKNVRNAAVYTGIFKN
jgi:hypothetical protein